MHEPGQLDELMICRLDAGRRELMPCTVVIFGASGDLTARKLIPALYHLHRDRQLPEPFRVVGFARREKTGDSWRAELGEAMAQFSRTKPVDASEWEKFGRRLSYCRGDVDDMAAYKRLAEHLGAFGDPRLSRNLLFYLAVSPSQFGGVVARLGEVGLLQRDPEPSFWQRVVVEKPFGHDLASARGLNADLTGSVHEKSIFRIDHYLGKETVQNILMFRFSNAIFEQLWSRQSVDHVQITVSETHGVGERGGYYEEAGALRDMVQNHLLQVLALVAMEPPVSLAAESIRDEKVKLLESIRPIPPASVPRQVVRGQYLAGPGSDSSSEPVPGYRQESKVKPDSNVETYVALKLAIDNWRWSGVPFYLRTGKRLPLGASEVRVEFRRTPTVLFAAQCGPTLDANALTLRLQPDEGISLRFNGKVPGASTALRPVRMHFSYDATFGAYTPEAYERLLLEALGGDATLFIRRDEVETAWGIVDAIREGWAGQPLTAREFYAAGSWGPVAADELLASEGRVWRNPYPIV
ncbi:MAG TPA: glucose-6-phosphate dehydrogenase [Candidatus Paceibacterota bacterium]|nr:glucose-6-phosphate dehydrogenase [Candidatus Paceibacterota bacterium]